MDLKDINKLVKESSTSYTDNLNAAKKYLEDLRKEEGVEEDVKRLELAISKLDNLDLKNTSMSDLTSIIDIFK